VKVTVLYFASLRGKTGVKQESLNLEAETTVARLLNLLAERRPEIAPHMQTVLVSINQEFAYPEDELSEGDDVALFPPVSGGAGGSDYVAISSEPFDIEELQARIVTRKSGAVCTFTGYVRGETSRGEPHETSYLEYEAYTPMAEAKLAQIAEEIHERWPDIVGVAIVQRTGRLNPEEPSVVVACSASHRDTGVFEAARFGIDRIKQIVPVWKKEVGPGGESWVEGDYIPGDDDRAR